MARPRWPWMAVGLLAAVAGVAARLTVPVLVGRAVDEGIVPGDRAATVHLALAIGGCGVAVMACSGLRRYGAFRTGFRVEADVRARIHDHAQRLDFGFHDRTAVGELLSHAGTDAFQIHMLLCTVPIGTMSVLSMVVAAVAMVAIDPLLAVVTLASLPLVTVAARRFAVRVAPISAALQGRLAAYASHVEETVTGIRAVKGLGAEEVQADGARRAAEAVRAEASALVRARARFLPLAEVAPWCALAAVLWVGGVRVIDGAIAVGDLVAFASFVLALVLPLRMLATVVGIVPRSLVAATRIDRLLGVAPAVRDGPSARVLPPGPGAVAFEDVAFGYERHRPVLRGFTLRLHPGETVALVGATGSGKSTVLRLLARFYELDGGRITVDGHDVRDLRLHSLRPAVAVAFEDPFLFSGTVRANVALGAPGASDAEIGRVLEVVGADFVAGLDGGIDGEVGEQGSSLSGGQRQRLALARAVLAAPRVLLLDDATSAVDASREREIHRALAAATEGWTTLVVAHRPATLALADRVVLLDEGRVAAEGTHEELLARSSRYREVLARGRGRDAGVGPAGPGAPASPEGDPVEVAGAPAP